MISFLQLQIKWKLFMTLTYLYVVDCRGVQNCKMDIVRLFYTLFVSFLNINCCDNWYLLTMNASSKYLLQSVSLPK